MQNSLELPKSWRLLVYASPLDENPEFVEFDFWDELQDWIQYMEDTQESFDLELVQIVKLKDGNGER